MSQAIVEKSEGGMRLDQWLVKRRLFPSRQSAKAALDAGLVRVGGRRVVIAKWALKSGDAVAVSGKAPTHRAREKVAGERPLAVLYEDAHLICVNKPAGVAVVATSHSAALTVVDMVRAYLRRKYPGARGTYVKALHRLDVETSGATLLAKSRIGEKVAEQFKIHSIDRRYVAMVSGAVKEEAGTISVPLEKGEFGKGRKVAPALKGEGKRAVTHFRVEERYKDASLLKLRVETGRTHQIRVHCASLGHPLLGDKLYGSATDIKAPRLALHAEYLKFYLPESGQKVECRAPLPADMQQMIDQYRERC
jgi:23S rRNA pseudouridine1911/1915/1917 synthase